MLTLAVYLNLALVSNACVALLGSLVQSYIASLFADIRKENNEARIRIRWVILKILLDAWQLFTTVVAPTRQGWAIDANGP
jgi:hypothetical protein